MSSDNLHLYTWKVGNFAQLISGTRQFINSPQFSFTTKGLTTKWHVRLNLNHKPSEPTGYLGIFIGLDSGGPVTVKWWITVVNGSGVHQLLRSTCIKKYSEDSHSTGWNKYVTYQKLQEETSNLLSNGELTLQISMQLYNTEEHFGHASRKFSLTQFSYVWEVGLFDEIAKPTSSLYQVHSPHFTDPSGDTRWHLILYPRGKSHSTARTARTTPKRPKKPSKTESLALELKLESKEAVKAKWSAAVIDGQGHLCHRVYSEAKNFTPLQCTSSVPQFLLRQTLDNHADRLLPAGLLTLYCQVEIIGENTSLDDIFPRSIYRLSKLLEEKAPRDLVLAVDGQEIAVHRMVLTVSSPVFDKMLETEMREAQLGRVCIEDFDSQVVRRMVQFLYDDLEGIESADLDTADKLLQVADKYEIDSLHKAAQRQLASLLTSESALRILVSAERYQAPRLVSHATEFIKTHALQVMTRPEWVNAIRHHSDLMANIHEQILPQLSSLSNSNGTDDNSQNEIKSKRRRTTVTM